MDRRSLQAKLTWTGQHSKSTEYLWFLLFLLFFLLYLRFSSPSCTTQTASAAAPPSYMDDDEVLARAIAASLKEKGAGDESGLSSASTPQPLRLACGDGVQGRSVKNGPPGGEWHWRQGQTPRVYCCWAYTDVKCCRFIFYAEYLVVYNKGFEGVGKWRRDGGRGGVRSKGSSSRDFSK